MTPSSVIPFEELHKTFMMMVEKPLPVVETVLFVITTAVGVIGNGFVCLIVVCRPALRTARNVFITNLAIGNLIMSMSLIPLIYIPGITASWPYGEAACKMVNAFCGTNVFASAFTVAAIALDRYVAAKHRNTSAIGMKQTVIGCLSMWFFAACLTAPIAIYHGTDQTTYPLEFFENHLNRTVVGAGNVTVLAFPVVCVYSPPFGIKVFLACIQLAFAYLIPFAAILTLNLQLQRVVRRRKYPLSTESNQAIAEQKRQRYTRANQRVTILLLAMSFSYGLLWLPTMLMTIMQDFFKDFLVSIHNSSLWDIRLMWVAYCSLCINPFLYGYFNKNFKRELSLFVQRRNNYPIARAGRTCVNSTCRPANRRMQPIPATRRTIRTNGIFEHGQNSLRLEIEPLNDIEMSVYDEFSVIV